MQEPVLTEDRKNQIIRSINTADAPEILSKRPLILMTILVALALGIAGFSFFRYAFLQKENFSLNDEVRKLNQSITALEEENKDLALKTERAEKEKRKLQEAIDAIKKQNESLQFEAKKDEARVNSVLEEKTYLEDILINKTKEIEKLKAGNASFPLGETMAAASADLVQQLNQKNQEISHLNDHNKILTEKLQKLYQMADEKMKEITIAKSALEETIADAKKVVDVQSSNAVDLGSIAVSQSTITAPVQLVTEKKFDISRLSSKKQGRVLAINDEHGFVVVDLGKVNGIRNGMELYLKKNGEIVATLSVLETRDVMTACNIKNVSSGRKIEINDQVSLQR
ncbi:MAG TPA: hypothetical protein VJA17_02695 [Candidatus Omnitrophota bacterium]|nr:hypothetical protein [Candidatus Omnitrophota bacterium]